MKSSLALLLALAPFTMAGPTWSHAATFRTSPRILSSLATTSSVVALSFDDGPSAYTAQILGILGAFHARATFFEVGLHVGQYPQAVRAVVGAGDELGNHTYTHADLQMLSDAGIADELARTQAAVKAVSGVTPRWFRPPYGAVDTRVAGVAASLGLQPVLWSVDPADWSRPGTVAIVARILAQTRPGSVILMHDGGGDREETVQALPIVLRALATRGYRFVSLGTLFGAPDAPLCDAGAASRRFGAAGIAPEPSHAIYRAWSDLYCQGIDLGPATSAERHSSPMTIEQDFARTGHRVEWNDRSHATTVFIVWSWAIAEFSARHVTPAWGKPITRSWFDQFFHGADWGPALAPQSTRRHEITQRFLYRDAMDRQGHVTWRSH